MGLGDFVSSLYNGEVITVTIDDAGGVTRSVKFSPHNHEGLSSIPRTHIESHIGWIWCPKSVLSVLGGGNRRIPGPAGQSA